MSAPLHTVIVPTYNQAQYLGAALDSILAQTNPSWEALVVNDGSTDGTAEIIDSYAARDPRFVAIHKTNGGVGSALNAGLERARGTWIHWLSSDDMFEPDKLAINDRWIESHPECKFFFSYFTLLREATGTIERRELWGPLPDPGQQVLAMFFRNCISGISICVSREAWRAAGFFDETLRYAQDFDQWLRLLRNNKAVFIPEWTVINRNHALQGSEVFPDACYFETALASIRFLNRHSFSEIVPWVDLSDLATSRSVVAKALDIAFERSSYLYCLGPNPALVLRVLEWVDTSKTPSADELRPEIIARIEEQALRPEEDAWQGMWEKLASALSNPDSRISYSPIDEIALIKRLYALRDFVPGAIAAQPPIAPASDADRMWQLRVVFLLPLGADADLRRSVDASVRDLVVSGVRVTLLDDSCDGYHWEGLVTRIRRGPNLPDQLAWIGRADVLLTFGEMAPVWLRVEHVLSVDRDDCSWPRVLQSRLETLSAPSPHQRTSPRPVAFLQRVLQGGGAERVVLDIVSRLDRQRYTPYVLTLFECERPADYPADVEVICVRDFPPRPRAPVVTPPPAPVMETGPAPEPSTKLHPNVMEAFDGHLPAGEGLQAVLSHLGPDTALVAVMEEATVAAWLAQIGRRLKFIASLHCVESLFLPQLWPKPARRSPQSWMLSNACNASERVFFPSYGCKTDLVTNFGVPAAHIEVLGNPVDCARIRRLSLQPSPDEAFFQDGRFVFANIGRLDPEKNLDLLIEACAKLALVRRDFTVLLVGSGSEHARLTALIEARGLGDIVHFAGRRENPFPTLRRAGALVLTSRLEAFALVLVEAMVCGVPVVSVDCPHGPREVLADGEAGVLTPNNDADALADTMLRIMTDPDMRERLVAAGYQRAADFDVRPIVEAWEAAIDTLLPVADQTAVTPIAGISPSS